MTKARPRNLLPLALLLLLLLVAPAMAQGADTFFKLDKYLDGYDQKVLGDYSDLYDFTPFQPFHKQFVTAAQLRELQGEWEAQLERVDAEIARLAVDPRFAYLRDLRRRLKRSTYFRHINYEMVDCGAVVFLVQDRKKTQRNYKEYITDQLYGPWLTNLESVFQSTYVEPLGLERHPDRLAAVIAVLATPGDYENYKGAVEDPGLYLARAHYDPDLRMALTYELFAREPGVSPNEKMHATLHEFVHALQHAYSTGRGLPQTVWFNEGLAEYLATHLSIDPDKIKQRIVNRDAVEQLGAVLSDPTAREVYYAPLGDLLMAKSYRNVVQSAVERASEAQAGLDVHFALVSFYAQAGLLMYFLHERGEGVYREPVLNYIAAELRGEGGRRGFDRAFEGTDLATLESEFLAFVGAEFEQLHPGAVVDTSPPIRASSSRRADSAARTAEAGAASEDAGGCGAVTPDVFEALLRRETLASAIGLARGGDHAGAVELLRTGLSGADAAQSGRYEREIERLEGWIDLRDRFLEQLRASGSKLKTKVRGRTVLARVEKVEDGVVHLGESKSGVRSIPLSELPPLELAVQMGDRKYAFNGGWLRLYPYVLAGDARWERLLKQSDPGADLLRQDADADYPTVLETVEVIAAVRRIAAGVASDSGVAHADALANVRVLVEDHGEHALVKTSSDALRAVACRALESAFDEGGLEQLVRGDLEREGEVVRVAYDFDDDSQFEDFESIDYQHDIQRQYEVAGGDGFDLRRGALVGAGEGCVRNVLGFRSPMTVEYTLTYLDTGMPNFLYAGICDDRYGSHVTCQGVDSLTIIDKKARRPIRRDVGSIDQLIVGSAYRMRVVHDGATVTVHCDGEQQASLSAEQRTGGAVFFLVHSNGKVAVDDLVIEGALDPDSLALRRRARVEAQLAAMGL